MSEDKIFVDTNILVYAYDNTAGRKHEIATALVSDLWQTGAGASSTQVLQEFYVTVTRKIQKPASFTIAREIVSDLLKWDIFLIDGQCILESIDLQGRLKIS